MLSQDHLTHQHAFNTRKEIAKSQVNEEAIDNNISVKDPIVVEPS